MATLVSSFLTAVAAGVGVLVFIFFWRLRPLPFCPKAHLRCPEAVLLALPFSYRHHLKHARSWTVRLLPPGLAGGINEALRS
jgi:hypothetical protein